MTSVQTIRPVCEKAGFVEQAVAFRAFWPDAVELVRGRLWDGQVQRALDLIAVIPLQRSTRPRPRFRRRTQPQARWVRFCVVCRRTWLGRQP
jgi:hypothetical protein